MSFIVFFLAIFIASPFVFAQEASSTKPDTSSTSQLEITFPVQREDFLLFYGVTKEQEINTKIDSLRKDFMSKFQAIKDDYKKLVTDTIGDNTLISPISLDIKDNAKVVTQIKKIDAKTSLKKYSLKTDKASSSEITISPIVNIIDVSSGIRTENSTWFQKVKSIFNW